jgi:hypothetical protein
MQHLVENFGSVCSSSENCSSSNFTGKKCRQKPFPMESSSIYFASLGVLHATREEAQGTGHPCQGLSEFFGWFIIFSPSRASPHLLSSSSPQEEPHSLTPEKEPCPAGIDCSSPPPRMWIFRDWSGAAEHGEEQCLSGGALGVYAAAIEGF